jgi:hypothetical protein
VSARCGWLRRAAIKTRREWTATGEVAPLPLAAGTPSPGDDAANAGAPRPPTSEYRIESEPGENQRSGARDNDHALNPIRAFIDPVDRAIAQHRLDGERRPPGCPEIASDLSAPEEIRTPNLLMYSTFLGASANVRYYLAAQ